MATKSIDISGVIIPDYWTAWIVDDPSYHTASSLMAMFRDLYATHDVIEVTIGVLYGGSIWEGRAVIAFMADMVAKGKMKVHVTGLAASMGAVMALRTRATADTYAQIMWHGASGGGYGTVADNEAIVAQLKQENALMVQMLQDVAGLPQADAEALLVGDNFLTAQKAFALNLISGVTDSPFGNSDSNTNSALNNTNMTLLNDIKTMGVQEALNFHLNKIMGAKNAPIVNKMSDNEKQALVAEAVANATAALTAAHADAVADLKAEIEGLKATHAQELSNKATALTADFNAKLAEKDALILELSKRPAVAQNSGAEGDGLQGGATAETYAAADSVIGKWL